MRYLRYLVLGVLGVALLTLAMANRQVVTLHLLPNDMTTYLGWNWQIALPLFAIILAAGGIGILLGFVWEWLREHKHRATASRKRREAGKLAREVERLRDKHADSRDEVLTLLETAKRAR